MERKEYYVNRIRNTFRDRYRILFRYCVHPQETEGQETRFVRYELAHLGAKFR